MWTATNIRTGKTYIIDDEEKAALEAYLPARNLYRFAQYKPDPEPEPKILSTLKKGKDKAEQNPPNKDNE